MEKTFKVGDEIYDSRICCFGKITEVIKVPPHVSLECWYGGTLYKHSGMGVGVQIDMPFLYI